MTHEEAFELGVKLAFDGFAKTAGVTKQVAEKILDRWALLKAERRNAAEAAKKMLEADHPGIKHIKPKPRNYPRMKSREIADAENFSGRQLRFKGPMKRSEPPRIGAEREARRERMRAAHE